MCKLQTFPPMTDHDIWLENYFVGKIIHEDWKSDQILIDSVSYGHQKLFKTMFVLARNKNPRFFEIHKNSKWMIVPQKISVNSLFHLLLTGQIYTLLRNRHSQKFLAYLIVCLLFYQTKYKILDNSQLRSLSSTKHQASWLLGLLDSAKKTRYIQGGFFK